MDGTRHFHELDNEVKKEFYTRDPSRKVVYTSNFNLYISKSADWKDTLLCLMALHPLNPLELSATCRYICHIHS